MQAIFLLKTLKIPSFTHSKSRSPHDGHQDPCYLSDLLSYSSPLALSTLGFFCSLNSGTVLLYSHDTENSRSSQMSAGLSPDFLQTSAPSQHLTEDRHCPSTKSARPLPSHDPPPPPAHYMFACLFTSLFAHENVSSKQVGAESILLSAAFTAPRTMSHTEQVLHKQCLFVS